MYIPLIEKPKNDEYYMKMENNYILNKKNMYTEFTSFLILLVINIFGVFYFKGTLNKYDGLNNSLKFCLGYTHFMAFLLFISMIIILNITISKSRHYLSLKTLDKIFTVNNDCRCCH